MKKFNSLLVKLLIAQILLLNAFLFCQQNSFLKLWYNKPAAKWVEALPLGNGRLSAMVFGNPAQEKIQLNENTVWAGSPYRNDNPNAKASLPAIRKLIFDGKFKEAQDLAEKDVITKIAHGMPYQSVGNLILTFPGHENFSNYYRELDIERAVATTKYSTNGIHFTREVFASFRDQVIIIRLTANQPGQIKFFASMETDHLSKSISVDKNVIILSGKTSDHEGIEGKVKFAALAKIITDGGKISSDGNNLSVGNANSATVYISIATNFVNYNNLGADEQKRAKSFIEKAIAKKYNDALSAHISKYQKYFKRVSLDLGITDAVNESTIERIKKFSTGNDPQLASLYFQFGRYLLISSSQPGGQPANLQGIWNESLKPAWDSKYTVNINTEMNYWSSEITNLMEMNEPLIQMIKELSVTGKRTAEDMYGCKGWVLHHNTDIWRINGPVDGAYWGLWPSGGAWLCQHLWDKYLFNGNKSYLKSIYPVLKSATEFYLNFLVEEPTHNWLVAAPSISPENNPSSRPKLSISAGVTMDNQLVFDLFTKTIAAAKVLKIDEAFTTQVQASLNKLPPMQIGKHSQLQEWLEDLDNPNDKHRHVSHLYGLHPGNQISPFHSPELASAAKTTLIQRGDESTGWSMGWKVNLWARLLDGNHAYKLISDQLKLVVDKDEEGFREGGGTYPNLFDAHPPFQIDGNFGCTSGIAEMLLQSHDGAVHILPALPDVWKNGNLTGLRARGGFEVDIKWKQGRIEQIKIKSRLGGNCRIRVHDKLKQISKFEMATAIGKNTNQYFTIPVITTPIISSDAKINKVALKEYFEYDLKTVVGKEYILTKE